MQCSHEGTRCDAMHALELFRPADDSRSDVPVPCAHAPSSNRNMQAAFAVLSLRGLTFSTGAQLTFGDQLFLERECNSVVLECEDNVVRNLLGSRDFVRGK